MWLCDVICDCSPIMQQAAIDQDSKTVEVVTPSTVLLSLSGSKSASSSVDDDDFEPEMPVFDACVPYLLHDVTVKDDDIVEEVVGIVDKRIKCQNCEILLPAKYFEVGPNGSRRSRCYFCRQTETKEVVCPTPRCGKMVCNRSLQQHVPLQGVKRWYATGVYSNMLQKIVPPD
jgi:hypothetical protein